MSKIHLPIAELKPALAGLGKIISRSSTLPVLGNIKVERDKDGGVVLTSTDLDHFISVRLEQPAQGEPESMLVPYDHLIRIVKRCQKNETISVGSDGDKALVQFPIGNQTGEEHLESLPVKDYPEVPTVKGECIPFHDDLRESMHEAFQCASVDETRRILNGVYLDVSNPGCHQLVSTDGRHLYGTNSFSTLLPNSLLIPEHKFLGWKEFNNDGEWELRVNKEMLQVSSRHWRFITRTIEGNYPNWRQVIPDSKQFNTTVELSPDAMESILALVPKIPCHDVMNNPIGLVVEGKKLMLRGRGANDSKWTDLNVEGVTVKGKPVTIFINRQFLTKALKFGMSAISIIDPLTPMKFSTGGKQLIVMPIRATEPAPTTASTPQASTPDAQPASSDASPPSSDNTASPTGDTSPERSTTMPKTTTPTASNGTSTNGIGNGEHHTDDPSKPAIEIALEKIEVIKTTHRESIRGLNDLADTLKQVQREQKTTIKEVASVRTTLEKLQQVRI